MRSNNLNFSVELILHDTNKIQHINSSDVGIYALVIYYGEKKNKCLCIKGN